MQSIQSTGTGDLKRLASGGWVITRWHIRATNIARRTDWRQQGQQVQTVTDVHESGGQVTEVELVPEPGGP